MNIYQRTSWKDGSLVNVFSFHCKLHSKLRNIDWSNNIYVFKADNKKLISELVEKNIFLIFLFSAVNDWVFSVKKIMFEQTRSLFNSSLLSSP